MRSHAKHLVYILGEKLYAVDPAHRDALEEDDDHESGRGRERVQERDQIHATVGDCGQRAQE